MKHTNSFFHSTIISNLQIQKTYQLTHLTSIDHEYPSILGFKHTQLSHITDSRKTTKPEQENHITI